MFRPVQESKLDNGLTVLTVANPTSPTATLQVWYRIGSRNESMGITGISHIFEHMMFKGTDRHPKGEFDRIVQENGMSYNAFTSHDFTAYFEVMAADRLEIAMELEADRMQGLTLDPKEFDSEMAVIREERRQTREDPPFGLLSESVEAAVFTLHPYRWPVIGWMTDLHTITLDDLKRYYGGYYRPNNAVLIVAGDVSAQQVEAMAARHFGSIAPGPDRRPRPVHEPRQLGERTVSVHKAVELPGILLAYRAPSSRERDAKVLNLIETLLFHGRSSRLYQSLSYRNQLTTGLSGGIHHRADPSTFLIQAMARPGVPIERVRETVYEDLERLQREPVPADELHKARTAIEAEYTFAQESNQELAQHLGAMECRGSWRDFDRFLEEHLEIGAEDIQRVAGETFRETNRTVGYLVPDRNAPGPNGDPPEPAGRVPLSGTRRPARDRRFS